jgi:hypothetical protein
MSSTYSLTASLMLLAQISLLAQCTQSDAESFRVIYEHCTSSQQLEIRVLSGAQNNGQKMVPVHYFSNVSISRIGSRAQLRCDCFTCLVGHCCNFQASRAITGMDHVEQLKSALLRWWLSCDASAQRTLKDQPPMQSSSTRLIPNETEYL